MGKLSVVSLTDRAWERVKEILQNNSGAHGLLVSVKKGGCAGMEYCFALQMDQPFPAIDVVEKDGMRVFIASEAILFLLGTEIDFEATILKTGFVFRNPNQISACGCGESVEIKPALAEELVTKLSVARE